MHLYTFIDLTNVVMQVVHRNIVINLSIKHTILTTTKKLTKPFITVSSNTFPGIGLGGSPLNSLGSVINNGDRK